MLPIELVAFTGRGNPQAYGILQLPKKPSFLQLVVGRALARPVQTIDTIPVGPPAVAVVVLERAVGPLDLELVFALGNPEAPVREALLDTRVAVPGAREVLVLESVLVRLADDVPVQRHGPVLGLEPAVGDGKDGVVREVEAARPGAGVVDARERMRAIKKTVKGKKKEKERERGC